MVEFLGAIGKLWKRFQQISLLKRYQNGINLVPSSVWTRNKERLAGTDALVDINNT